MRCLTTTPVLPPAQMDPAQLKMAAAMMKNMSKEGEAARLWRRAACDALQAWDTLRQERARASFCWRIVT